MVWAAIRVRLATRTGRASPEGAIDLVGVLGSGLGAGAAGEGRLAAGPAGDGAKVSAMRVGSRRRAVTPAQTVRTTAAAAASHRVATADPGRAFTGRRNGLGVVREGVSADGSAAAR
jgi:hypothetical protein